MPSIKNKNDSQRMTPTELRNMFGANLRQLTQEAPSISALCRDLGINRTQFNRYLSGESFPRPDILYKICGYFNVDARILLEPIDKLGTTGDDLLKHPQISEFIGTRQTKIEEHDLPSGIYRFSRRSFINDELFVRGVSLVYRENDFTFVRGYEAPQTMRQQGLAQDAKTREYRGFFMMQEGGLVALVARRGSMSCSFNYISHVPSFENNFWCGYTTRTANESLTESRSERMVYEYLGQKRSEIMRAARSIGFCKEEDIDPYHLRLLRTSEAFR